MSTTALDEVLGVRSLLNNPLSQAPSFKDILEELEAEYQNVFNETNNTGNAWQVCEYTLTTTEGQRRYRIAPPQFYKALAVTTVPADDNTDPQYPLEFTELEHLPQEWAWLGENKGQLLYSSHDAQMVAFYRKLGKMGAEQWVELRPTPTRTQQYTILYQITDWWVTNSTSLDSTSHPLSSTKMPHSSQRFYIRALVAQNLLLTGKVQWQFDDKFNLEMGKIVADGLKTKIERYKPVFDEYKDSLDNPDITYISSWADDNVFL